MDERNDQARALIGIDRALADAVDALSFSEPVTHVYNPLRYARAPHEAYLREFGNGVGRVVLLGMNPGPFGMAQTGVPFGDIALVRDWMGVMEAVGKPKQEHPKRPVEGFQCQRSEVSGTRLWGWAAERYGSAEAFFRRYFVVNYCPLSFMEDSGRNRTPDKLPAAERDRLFEVCDQALRECVAVLRPQWVLGVGRFAENRARKALGSACPKIATILHPSPASPAANRGWAEQVERQLKALGLPVP